MTQNVEDLKLDNYNFDLPENLIAQRPTNTRSGCRLLIYDASSGVITHTSFKDILKYLPSKSTLTFNRSKVIPCRLFGKKPSGGQCEIVVLNLIKEEHGYKCLVRSSGKKKLGDTFIFENNLIATIKKVEEGHFWLDFNCEDIIAPLSELGLMPIPPYIRGGKADDKDKEDYQTIFAKEPGSIAAPTAGLHFDDELLSKLKEQGHELTYTSLHVGLGTFAPVKTNNLEDHKMHCESYMIDSDNLEIIKNAQKRIAIGTTSLRSLESSFDGQNWNINSDQYYDTQIFLHPGVEVKSIDGLLTNFHLPKSTLLMLVAALIGREKTLELYKIAVEKEYRFYSYGDAMLILR